MASQTTPLTPIKQIYVASSMITCNVSLVYMFVVGSFSCLPLLPRRAGGSAIRGLPPAGCWPVSWPVSWSPAAVGAVRDAYLRGPSWRRPGWTGRAMSWGALRCRRCSSLYCVRMIRLEPIQSELIELSKSLYTLKSKALFTASTVRC